MNWPLRPVSELCEFAYDCVNKTAPAVDYETPFKMIRTTNVKGGFINLDEVKYVTEETFEKWTRRSRPQYGDVVLTREAPVGEVGRCTFGQDQNIFLGQRLFHYRPDPRKLDWNFLAYILQSPLLQNKLHGMGFGATVPHIKVGNAEHLPIPCPPLEVQRALGTTLANYDDLIETNRRRIALLEESARLLYREWFVKLRFPGHEQVKKVDGVPEGWAHISLADLAQVNANTVKARETMDDIRYIDIAAVETGVINAVAKIPFSDAPGRARRKVKHGDVIWSCVRPNRKSYALIWEPEKDTIVSTGFAVLSAKRVPFTYLYLSATTDDFTGYLTNRATGAAYPAVTAKDFETATLLKPTDGVLHDFHEMVEPIFEMQEIMKVQNQRLAEARDALLPKLMSGQLTV